MDTFDKTMGYPRGTQRVTLEVSKPNGYLRKTYELPEPCTAGEYLDVLDDLHARYKQGERTEGGTAE